MYSLHHPPLKPKSNLVVVPDDIIRFTCSPRPTIIGTHFCEPQQPQPNEFRPNNIYSDSGTESNWAGNERVSTSGDGSEDDDDDDDEEVEELGVVNENNNDDNINSVNNGSSNISGRSSATADNIGLKEGNVGQCGNDINNNSNKDVRASLSGNHQEGRVGQSQNAVTIAAPDGDLYYSQYLSGQEGENAGHKDIVVENGYGISGRSESGESLRMILSDPLTGALMEDAIILPCGHSFGGAGIQHVIKMKACYTCSQAVSEESVAPNLCNQPYVANG